MIKLIANVFLFIPAITFAARLPAFDATGELVNMNLPEANVFATVAVIINYMLSFLGIVALCLILYAGFMWMWARGNEEEIKKSQEILKGAAIGLAIILGAYSISYFVFSNLVEIIADTAL